jgi:hypothetical protein
LVFEEIRRRGGSVKLGLLLAALLLGGVRFAYGQDDAPEAETRRNVDTAMVFAIAADFLCGTNYQRNVIANLQHDGVDDIVRRDKPQIDERAKNLIAQNNDKERKERFCEKIRRDAESSPEE